MGRALGSPNIEYKWEFTIYDPTSSHKIFSKKFTSIRNMHEQMKNVFSLSQLTSYASKSRNCPKIIEVARICEPVHS